MGTNYYLHINACPTCQRGDGVVHIGKSSGGWCFSLHVADPRLEHDPTFDALIDQPEALQAVGLDGPPRNFADWLLLILSSGADMRDEHGSEMRPAEMIRRIAFRGSGRSDPVEMERNNAEPGPRGLWRHRINQYCIGHGEGSWDYVTGNFS